MIQHANANGYCVAIYLRLSKEDGDISVSSKETHSEKRESNSIANQRLIIQDYIKKNFTSITEIKEYCDDGFSGANFDRPAFQSMLADIRAGLVNCVIVKDLSRFGREYIHVGKYIEKIFPQLNVRFIAINDSFDSNQTSNNGDILSFVVKNLMNDAYCRDISIKVRTNLEAKRKSGQFVGSHVIYGYQRSPEDKHKLIPDPVAARVVQDIYCWKIDGMSPEQIANRLNDAGVLSPIEYKRANGSKQKAVFQKRVHAIWSAVAIYRILKNPIYTGQLVQGRTTTPNHKIKKTIIKSPDDWVYTENAHEAIISPAQYELVQNLLLEDTRTPVKQGTVHLFSGKIVCGSCGHAMVRRTSTHGKSKYVYFVCGNNKLNPTKCSSHSIRESLVEDTVLAVLQTHIASVLDINQALENAKNSSWEQSEIARVNQSIHTRQEQLEHYEHLITSAYEDLQSNFFDYDEYSILVQDFKQRIENTRQVIATLNKEKSTLEQGLHEYQTWLEQFKQYQNITSLDRRTIATLIDHIVIHDNKEIEVNLLYKDFLNTIQQYICKHQTNDKKEVV